MNMEKRQKAIDLSHHLSEVSRARTTSPLKGLSKYFGRPGLISLAGGLPSEDYFPFDSVAADVLVPDSFSLKATGKDSSLSWFWKLFGTSSKTKTTPISILKYPENPGDVNLATALQYGMATGLPQLQKFIKDFVEKVYQPAYSDCTIMAHIGNTDGWSRVMQTVLNPGEGFLTEEWTYPSVVASSKPYGIHAVPVAMDKDGMSSVDLRKVLSEWDEKVRGCKRYVQSLMDVNLANTCVSPRVIYTVPIGQNPCGSTMEATRKKEIYNICVEYDIIIVEDDPYFFLQQGEYIPKASQRSQDVQSEADWLASLAPSYLKFDYEGRVIRLDTFSKYIAPGSRLGWHTCNPMFAERLERQGETSAQAPNGFGQSLITQLLTTWGQEGYVRWLHGLAVQYKTRRDYFIDCLADEFHLEASTSNVSFWKNMVCYDAYAKPSGRNLLMSEKGSLGTKFFSFVPPTSGMFLWIQIHFENHPAYRNQGDESLEIQLWTKIADAGVLISPGWFFAADVENPPTDEMEGHFRISFSNCDFETLKKAASIIAKVTQEFFKE